MNFLCFLLITSWTTLLAKPQYDIVNSGSSATAAKPSSKSGPIVRVDGDVHSEKAEENNLPSGLHPSNYDSDGQASRASPASSPNKNGQKPSGSNKKPQSSPADHSITVDATKPKNNASAANLTIVPTKRPPTNAYESDAAPKTQQKAAKSPEGFVLGGESTTASSDSYQSTTPEISSSAETPTTSSDSYQSTTDMPETTSASTASISSSEQPSESPSSTEQTTPSSTTVESTTTSASYEESKEEKHDDNKQPFSSELYESSTPTSDVNAESSLNSGNASAKNVDSAAATNTASSETTIEQTTEQSSSTTSQSSYESSESGSDSSLPTPPTTQNTVEETSTLPPAIEPSSPGTTPEHVYDSTTPSASVEQSQAESTAQPTPASSEPETTSSEAQVAASSSSEQPNTPAPDYSAQTTEATSVEQTSQSTAGDYSQTTQPYESSTASSLNSAEPTASADASRNSGGYNPDSPPVSVLKPPTNSANQRPESQPQSPAYQPPKKPRAWKISQGNGNSMPVDGSTGNSDNTINAAKPSEQTNKHIQSSGYGENEMKTQSEKPAHVVSPQEAVGYDGIAETPSTMTQRDPIIERAEVSLTKLQKQIDSNSTPKRKWQKYKFDCETEQDDRGETLCQEWARGGLCEDHRPTRFLFCRLTCLCLGPPEDPITQLKQKRRKRLNNVRL